jgi:hypothetical protein
MSAEIHEGDIATDPVEGTMSVRVPRGVDAPAGRLPTRQTSSDPSFAQDGMPEVDWNTAFVGMGTLITACDSIAGPLLYPMNVYVIGVSN